MGLIGAAELVADKAAKRPFHPTQAVGAYCSGRAEVHGLIVRAMVDSIAFCPPLIITESEIDEMFNRFAKALDETEMWVTKNGLRNVSYALAPTFRKTPKEPNRETREASPLIRKSYPILFLILFSQPFLVLKYE